MSYPSDELFAILFLILLIVVFIARHAGIDVPEQTSDIIIALLFLHLDKAKLLALIENTKDE